MGFPKVTGGEISEKDRVACTPTTLPWWRLLREFRQNQQRLDQRLPRYRDNAPLIHVVDDLFKQGVREFFLLRRRCLLPEHSEVTQGRQYPCRRHLCRFVSHLLPLCYLSAQCFHTLVIVRSGAISRFKTGFQRLDTLVIVSDVLLLFPLPRGNTVICQLVMQTAKEYLQTSTGIGTQLNPGKVLADGSFQLPGGN